MQSQTPWFILVTLFLVTLSGLMLMLASTDIHTHKHIAYMVFGIGLLSFIWGGISLVRLR